MSEFYKAGDGRGRLTQNAGTRIQGIVGGMDSFYTNVAGVRVTTSTTAHVLTLMRPTGSRSTAASSLAAAGTALVSTDALTDGDGNALAANDLVAVKLDNGSWHFSVASGWNGGTKTITLATAIPTGRSVAAGAKIVSFGAAADTFHADYKFTCTASTSNNFPAVDVNGSPMCKSRYAGEPVAFDIDNGTAASTLEYITVGYSRL